MHDRNGTLLKQGDVVMVPMTVKTLNEGEDFCNLSLESLHGRRPDGLKEQVYAINTGVVVLYQRADEQA